eukprot:6492434-Alexandrium_andersonii.AAC.1
MCLRFDVGRAHAWVVGRVRARKGGWAAAMGMFSKNCCRRELDTRAREPLCSTRVLLRARGWMRLASTRSHALLGRLVEES